MSSFFVSKKTITSILLNLDVPMEYKTELGKSYLRLNYKALNARYDLFEDERLLYISQIESYIYNENDLEEDDKTLLQSFFSLQCLLYQCCEGNIPAKKLYRDLGKIGQKWGKRIRKMFPSFFDGKKKSILDLCNSMELKWDL